MKQEDESTGQQDNLMSIKEEVIDKESAAGLGSLETDALNENVFEDPPTAATTVKQPIKDNETSSEHKENVNQTTPNRNMSASPHHQRLSSSSLVDNIVTQPSSTAADFSLEEFCTKPAANLSGLVFYYLEILF